MRISNKSRSEMQTSRQPLMTPESENFQAKAGELTAGQLQGAAGGADFFHAAMRDLGLSDEGQYAATNKLQTLLTSPIHLS